MEPEPETAHPRAKPHRRGRNVDPDIRDEIERLHLQGFSGAAIGRHLADDDQFAPRAPGERAIQALIKRLSPSDRSGRWRPIQSPSRESRIDQQKVLPVGGWLMAWSSGARSALSTREAQWLTTILAAVPTIPPKWAYTIARRYMAAEDVDASTERLDRLLAIAPWENPEMYDVLVRLGVVDRVGWVSDESRTESWRVSTGG